MTEITGIAAVKEHLPKPDKSLINAIFFKAVLPFYHIDFIICKTGIVESASLKLFEQSSFSVCAFGQTMVT